MNEKLDRFLDVIAENGELFFQSGDDQQDLAEVENIIGAQGYWAGSDTRYYFDINLNLVKTENTRGLK